MGATSRASGCSRSPTTTSCFGGVSPINAQNRALIAALERGARRARDRPADLLRQPQLAPVPRRHARARCATTGVARALAFFTSAFSSYSGCRQYREDISARAGGGRAGRARGVRSCGRSTTTPGSSRRTPSTSRRRSRSIPAERRAARTSSSPRTASRWRWRGSAATRTSSPRPPGSSRRRSASPTHSVVYQSRSGSPRVPWLEPDVCDHIRAARRAGRQRRRRLADRLRLRPHGGALRPRRRGARGRASRRASRSCAPRTAGTHPAFVAMIRELIEERLDPEVPRRARRPLRPEPRRLRARLLPAGLVGGAAVSRRARPTARPARDRGR